MSPNRATTLTIALLALMVTHFLATPVAQTNNSSAVSTTSIATVRKITDNDFLPEQVNIIETIVVLVQFSAKRTEPFELWFENYWDRVFGLDNPHTQLNAYYRENFYNQLQLRPVQSPERGTRGYITVELEGSPQDYSVGWLIGTETEKLKAVNPKMVQKVILDVMAKVMRKHPEMNFQDKFIFIVLNAFGSEYGRSAMGALPIPATEGADTIYDLFIGDIGPADLARFSDNPDFRIVDNKKVVGVIKKEGYTFENYFYNRKDHFKDDQFIRGMAILCKDACLSCASHDIVHGLRRKSAFADPPEARSRAVNCLYNLQLQNQWTIGTERGPNDRSICVSPFIGWWDPMADHLHPRSEITRSEFFAAPPQGMCAFTKLRMGLIPERCIAIVDKNDMTIKLASLSSPTLPSKGAEAESIVIKVPIAPNVKDLSHVYLLLEYRKRVGSGPTDFHPDSFQIDPDYAKGDKTTDPGYNKLDPARSRYINPPMKFVSDEGVLTYLVNEKMPEGASEPDQPWNKFVLALLNPQGNEKREDLTQATLDTGESMAVDFQEIYAPQGPRVKITISVMNRMEGYSTVHIVREYAVATTATRPTTSARTTVTSPTTTPVPPAEFPLFRRLPMGAVVGVLVIAGALAAFAYYQFRKKVK